MEGFDYIEKIYMKKVIFLLLFFIYPLYSGESKVLLLKLSTTINPATYEYINSGIEKANKGNYSVIIIELDTPGGLLSTTREIVKSILSSPIPIIVYVYPPGAHAGSAGVFVTMAANVAAMAPGTNIGAAHPVTIGQSSKDSNQKELMQKVENDSIAFIKSIAKLRGKNQKWAELAVKKSITATAEDALKEGVIDIIADNIHDLLLKIDGRKTIIFGNEVILHTKNSTVETYQMETKYKIINTLANPELAYLLMLLGILGIYLELSHPGLILPGVAGGISIILAGISFQFLPINTGGLLLILLALLLIILELFLPTMGVLAISGVVSFIIGSLLLFDPSTGLHIRYSVIFSSSFVFSLFVLLVSFLVYKAHKRGVKTGKAGLIGEMGNAVTKINANQGKVFVHGEYWNAVSKEEIDKDSKIEIEEVNGMELKVKKYNKGG